MIMSRILKKIPLNNLEFRQPGGAAVGIQRLAGSDCTIALHRGWVFGGWAQTVRNRGFEGNKLHACCGGHF